MRSYRFHRSIAFQLWWRLSLALVAFTLLVYPMYLWIETADNIAEAEEEASIRATVAAGSIRGTDSRPAGPNAPSLPTDGATIDAELYEQAIETFGLLAIERLHREGHVLGSWGTVKGPESAAAVEPGRPRLGLEGWSVSVSGGTYQREEVSPLGLLRRDSFAYVYVVATGPEADGAASHRIVVDAGHLTGEAYTLLFRSLAFAGAMLALVLVTLWFLLRYFVTRPMREYSDSARRIAAGEPLRMPENQDNEIGELGAAINTMADALRRQATIDSLTGLGNLRHLRETLPALLDDARENHQPLCLASIDVNNLKPVNDELGHAAGDQVLVAIADALRAWGGPDATHWRVGGDEFVVALPQTSARLAVSQIAALEALLAERAIDVEGHTITPDVAVGIAAYPEDGRTMAQLLAVGDARMYERKAQTKAA